MPWVFHAQRHQSLFGMILVIGILVDDGIVIGENIYSYHEKGDPPHRGGHRRHATTYIGAVFAAIVTTVIAFSSFFFLDGSLGDFFPEMAIVVIFSLIFSWWKASSSCPPTWPTPRPSTPTLSRTAVQRSFDSLMNLLRDRMYVRPC